MEDSFGFGLVVRFADNCSAGLRSAQSSVDSLWTSMKRISPAAAAASAALGRGLGGAARAASGACSAFGRALTSDTPRIDHWANRVVHAQSRISLFGRILRSLTFFYFARQLWGVVKDFVAAGTQFEQTMVNIASVLGMSGRETAALSEKMRVIGRTTAFSAQEAAEGMFILAKAGIKNKEAMDALTPALNLAVVGEMGLEKATEIMISTMVQFGKTRTAAEVANVLAAGANASTAEVKGLAIGMASAAPVAHLFGISLERTTAILGMFDQAGFKGARGGIAFRNLLTDLTSGAPKVKAAFHKIGVSMKDVDPRHVDFKTILDRMKPMLDHTDLAVKAFGKQTYVRIATLVKMGSEALSDLEKSMAKSLSAEQIYAMRVKTLGGAFHIMKNQASELGLTLYDMIRPLLIERTKSMAALFSRLYTLFQRIAPTLRNIVTAVQNAFSAMGKSVGGTIEGMFPTLTRLATAGKITEKELEMVNLRFSMFAAIMLMRAKRFFGGFADGFRWVWDRVSWVADKLWRAIHRLGVKVGIFSDESKKSSDKCREWGEVIGGLMALAATWKMTWLVGGWLIKPIREFVAAGWWMWSNFASVMGNMRKYKSKMEAALSWIGESAKAIWDHKSAIINWVKACSAENLAKIVTFFRTTNLAALPLATTLGLAAAAATAAYLSFKYFTDEKYRADVNLGWDTLLTDLKHGSDEFVHWAMTPHRAAWSHLRSLWYDFKLDLKSWLSDLDKQWTMTPGFKKFLSMSKLGIHDLWSSVERFLKWLEKFELPVWLKALVYALTAKEAPNPTKRGPNILAPAPTGKKSIESPHTSYTSFAGASYLRPAEMSYATGAAGNGSSPGSGTTITNNITVPLQAIGFEDKDALGRALVPYIDTAVRKSSAEGRY